MRILDENNNEVKEVDRSKGYAVSERIIIAHHEAVEAIEEKGHWVTIAEYPNGGKDIEWVVDVPAVEAKEAYDEYEDILRFIPFTEAELATIRITELKQKLQDTDYNILKIVEGATTIAKCADIIKQRAEWRKEINELEGKV
jgi:hypothetical protein